MTAETKWTPGPWRISDGTTVWALTPSARANRFWATVSSLKRAHEGEAAQLEIEATARLIAAAPDLYAALRRVRNYVDAENCYPEILAAVDAALAKARGETP